MVRFGSRSAEQGSSRRPPPPNYLARSTQIRLLMLVGSLMLVLYLMWEARNPKNWAWIWAFGQQKPPAVSPEPAPDTVNTLLPPTSTEESDGGTVFAESPDTRQKKLAEAEPDGDALSRTRRSFWSQLVENLAPPDRTLLDSVLASSRNQSPLNEEDRKHWGVVFEGLSKQWDDLHEQAVQAVNESGDEMPAQERPLWLQVLQDVNEEWSENTRIALGAPLDSRSWTSQEHVALARLQETLDDLALEAVRDDTVWRGAEQYAWFRLVEKLKNTSQEQAGEAPETPIGFLALFRQPEAHRGKLVRFHGTATLAYRVQAPQNIHGIEHYFVFWLRPKGGPNSPLVVYALEPPPGFPEIKDKDVDKKTTRLEEDFEVVGYFFKRWAYRAQDGLNTAPVLLTLRPLWISAPAEKPPSSPPVFSNVVFAVLAVAVLAIGLAGLAYWSNRPDPTVQRFVKEAESRVDASVPPADAPLGVQESLQRLAGGEIGEEKLEDLEKHEPRT